jgi:hypothetical protein
MPHDRILTPTFRMRRPDEPSLDEASAKLTSIQRLEIYATIGIVPYNFADDETARQFFRRTCPDQTARRLPNRVR